MLGMLNRVKVVQKRAAQWRSAPVVEEERHELLAAQPTPPPTLEEYFHKRYPKYEYAPHTKAVIEFLDSLEPGDFAVLNMPPRHGKSEDVSLYLEHRIGCNPELEVMFTAFSARLATKRSRVIRNAVLNNEAFHTAFPHVKLARGSRSVQQWTLEQGGSFLCAGVGGSIVGLGAQILVFDDLVKGRKQAESQNVRDSTWDWLTADALTRLAPESIVILIQTRWHNDDPTGRVLEALGAEDGIKGFRLRHLELRAIAEEDDALGREVGQPLWTRWGLDKLERNRKILGEYDFASLYQQRPFLRGGNVFNDTPARFDLETHNTDGWRITITADLAASTKRTADFTVFCVMAHKGFGEQRVSRIINIKRGQWTLDQITQVAIELQAQYGQTIAIEQVAQQVAIVNHIESRGCRVKRIFPSRMGDKFARAQPAAAAWNAGWLEVPLAAPWLDDLMLEVTHFTGTPADAHDDVVDTIAYGWYEGEISPSPPAAPAATGVSKTQFIRRM